MKIEDLITNGTNRQKIPGTGGPRQSTIDLRCSIEREKRIENCIQHAILRQAACRSVAGSSGHLGITFGSPFTVCPPHPRIATYKYHRYDYPPSYTRGRVRVMTGAMICSRRA